MNAPLILSESWQTHLYGSEEWDVSSLSFMEVQADAKPEPL